MNINNYYFESDERDTTIEPPTDDWKTEEMVFGEAIKEIASSCIVCTEVTRFDTYRSDDLKEC
jgi:hypothetical protein